VLTLINVYEVAPEKQKEFAEVLSWMDGLPRMEAHILDGGHMLLETHAAEAASLMLDFIRHTQPRAR